MATVDIKNLKNEVVGKLDLSDEVFSGPVNEGLLYDAVKQYLASQRSGTHQTKTRKDVSGSGKIPIEITGLPIVSFTNGIPEKATSAIIRSNGQTWLISLMSSKYSVERRMKKLIISNFSFSTWLLMASLSGKTSSIFSPLALSALTNG